MDKNLRELDGIFWEIRYHIYPESILPLLVPFQRLRNMTGTDWEVAIQLSLPWKTAVNTEMEPK